MIDRDFCNRSRHSFRVAQSAVLRSLPNLSELSTSFIKGQMVTVCVFCGTATGIDPCYAEVAREVARLLAHKGCRIVYGGGKLGLMGVVAETALAAGGNVIGIAPKLLIGKEIMHRGLTELHVVETIHERKVMMMGLADAFLILPGGYGTLDELFEVLT